MLNGYELQGQFRPRKRQYFEKRFLSAYSTGFKVPETRVGKKKLRVVGRRKAIEYFKRSKRKLVGMSR